MKSENNLRMQLKEALDNLWARIKSLVSGLDTRVTALEQGGGGGGQVNVIEAISFNGTNVPPDASKRVSLQEADPTVPSWAKATNKPSYTASEVGALADTTTFVSGVKGSEETTYRSGQVDLSPANIGAYPMTGGDIYGPLNRLTNVDYDTPPSANVYTEVAGARDADRDIVGGLYSRLDTSAQNAFYMTARDGRGAATTLGVTLSAAKESGYEVSHPYAFRDAIGLGIVQNSLLLNATTGAGLYAQLSGMLAAQDGWPGVVCFISNDALKLLTGKTTLTSNVHGVITRMSSARFRVFGMYGDTGYIMYWAFDITSAGVITPQTVYRLTGTAM